MYSYEKQISVEQQTYDVIVVGGGSAGDGGASRH